MCTPCFATIQTIVRSVDQSFEDVRFAMTQGAIQAYTHIAIGVNETQKVVNQIAIQVFKAIRDILNDLDATKSIIQIGLTGFDVSEVVGVPMVFCKTMIASLNTVLTCIFAKYIFQDFDTLARTKLTSKTGDIKLKHITTLVGNSAFALSDGIGFSKWCSDNHLMGESWYNRPISVLGKSLTVSPEQVETAASLVGFSANITNICRKAWKKGYFTPESTVDLVSHAGKVVSIVAFQLPKRVGFVFSALSNMVSQIAFLALFLGRRPGYCWEPKSCK